MEIPVHVRDQREAAHQDALQVAILKTGGKMGILFVMYPDYSRGAQAGVCINHCESQVEAMNLAALGHALQPKVLELFREVGQQMFGTVAPASDPPANQPEDVVNLVAKAADAIVRNCIAYGRLAPAGGWTDADLLTRVRSLAPFAVDEEWRKKQ